MGNILKNSWVLLTRNKEYISSIIVSPIIMLLLFSFILSFQSKTTITVINQDQGDFGTMIEKTIQEMDFVKLLTIDADDVENDIIKGKIDSAIIIKKNASHMNLNTEQPIEIIGSQNATLSGYMQTVLNNKIESYKTGSMDSVSVQENKVSKKGIPITNALGLVIFKMIAAASLLASLLISEKNNGIRNRIYMSKTKLSTYLVGRGLIFFLHLLVFSLVYFLTASLLNFDFEMKYPIRILPVFIALSAFTVAYGLLSSSFVSDDNTVWRFGVLVLLPTSILSGALFPFESMPKLLQTVGYFFPQRWVTMSIETLQNGGTLGDTWLPMSGVLGISLLFVIIASVRIKTNK